MSDRRQVKCSHLTRAGMPCQRWATVGSEPPACPSHGANRRSNQARPDNQNPRKRGFYGRVLTVQELADLVDHANQMSLEDEIALARVALHRVLAHLKENPNLATAELTNLLALAFRGTRTVAHLLRDQRALTGAAADGLLGAIAQALDELGTEWGVEL
ncbi:MAG: hypothetical protein AB1791_09965 [Chloroflexota bacterium]